jgi:lycopene beta-cyclase
VPGDVFARFMTDLSTPAEDARVIAALPKAPFLAALARSVRARR